MFLLIANKTITNFVSISAHYMWLGILVSRIPKPFYIIVSNDVALEHNKLQRV